MSALEGCVKVQVKRQLRETKDKKTESSLKKQLSCCENSKSCMRLVMNFRSRVQMFKTRR